MNQAGYENAAADAGIWVDPNGIDAKSWHRVQLHPPMEEAPALIRHGVTRAQLSGWTRDLESPVPVREEPGAAIELIEESHWDQRVIPADCVRRLPVERARVTRLPPRTVRFGRRRRLFSLSPSTYEQRRGRAAAWGLLVVWLIGTWGTFYGLTGGLKSNEKSKAVVNTSSWSW